MDIRHNGLFYQKGKTETAQYSQADLDVSTAAPASTSNKILLCAYKDLIEQFNQLDVQDQKILQLEINIIARQLAKLFKQEAKKGNYSGYPASSLLKEIRLLNGRINEDALQTS